jgi:MurNAc alpha-1-phosphate uridylyltransferase
MSRGDELPAVCILAGGLGQRLGELVRDVPKPLLPVGGEPFLMHQLRLLSRHGVTRVVLSVGYLGDLIESTIGRGQFGINIDYSYDGSLPIGTLGAIRKALPLLGSPFLVMYGDTYLRMDYRAAWLSWRRSKRAALMTVLHNDGRWDRSNAACGEGIVLRYDKYSPTPEMHWIDYGLGGLTERALESAEHDNDLALLYSDLAERRELCSYEASERFFEIGSPQALKETDQFLRSLRASTASGRRVSSA